MMITPIRLVLQATSMWLRARVPLRDQRGSTAVEYGIVVVFVAAVIVIAVVFLGASTHYSLDCSGKTVAAHSPQCP
jgi:Flp pilus assembly pilin Flp